jgi:sarcosine oxidase subunit alpha
MIPRKNRTLEQLPTCLVDPTRKIRFRFGMGWYRGYAGDTIATALCRNGLLAIARSPGSRRPRGIWSLDDAEGRLRVAVNGAPDFPAETTRLQPGMAVVPQSPKFWEAGPLKARFRRFADRFPDPPPALEWLPLIGKRRPVSAAAGLDPAFRSRELLDAAFLHCEVCVVGGGPAGMMAALAAAESGLRVILLERNPRLGGHFLWRGDDYGPELPLYRRADHLAGRLDESPDVRIFLDAAVHAVTPDGTVRAVQSGGEGRLFHERRLRIAARRIVVATGRRERFPVFENNDRPGVISPDAACRLARLYGIMPGKKAVAAVADDAGLQAALDLHELGLPILAVADRRIDGADSDLRLALLEKELPFLRGWIPRSVTGNKRVREVELVPLGTGEGGRYSVDLLIASAGRTPADELLAAAGTGREWAADAEEWRPAEPPEGIYAAGGLLGIEAPADLEHSGRFAGRAAARDLGAAGAGERRPPAKPSAVSAGDISARWEEMNPNLAFVRPAEELALADLVRAGRAGIDHPEIALSWLGGGMAAGKAALADDGFRRALAWAGGLPPEAVKPAPAASPSAPPRAGTLAAGRRDPVRRTPLVEQMAASGVLPARLGDWLAPARFGADPQAADELAALRAAAGLMDGSARGKFRVFGPGALTALHRIYVNNLAPLKIGDAATAAMCHPEGYPLDIGEIARHDRDEFFVTTRPERADLFESWILEHAPADCPPFHVVDLTDALGTLILAGAAAEIALQRLTRQNVSAAALPAMGYRRVLLDESVPARILRTDALAVPSYDIHVPSSQTAAVWDLIMDAGAEMGIRPFGHLAAGILRLRRGGIDLERESDFRTTLVDLRLGKLWGIERTTPRPLGEAAWRRAMDEPGRIKRVFFRGYVNGPVPPEGSVVVDDGRPAGRVCLCRFHPDIRAAMGTALVPEHLAEPDTRLFLAATGDPEEEWIEVEIREPDDMERPVRRGIGEEG